MNMSGYEIPKSMKAWVLGDPDVLELVDKPVPKPGTGEVLVRIDAVAICATDLEIINEGSPALIEGELPFNKNFTPGHEYMGTIVELGPTVDEYAVGDRIAVEIHAGCGRCERCRMGMYTSCLNYGANYDEYSKGHRANGYTTDGAFTQYAVNHVNTLVRVPDFMTDEVATLIVTAGTAMYGLDVLGGLVAGQGLVVTGAGPIGLLGVAVGKALGADPVILTDIVQDRLEIGKKLGADHVINVKNTCPVKAVREANSNRGVNFVLECSGAQNAVNDAIRMVSRGGRVCLAAFSHGPASVDTKYIVANNIYLYGIRGEGKSAVRRAASLMKQKRFDASLVHTHTFPLSDLPTGLKYAREKIDGAIKVVIKNQE
ncbi:MAG: alcohol dehydrogenase catalytic domain-containing protein [Gammaproteobacteria bacterium]|nr:alcohol dehydrogenase catalytic domain-containing protein [Gammaproteobacteria bacterium]